MVGLGARDAFDPERARVAAAGIVAACEGARHALAVLGAAAPDVPAHAAAFVEGTLLAAYDYRKYKSGGGEDDEDAEEAGRLAELLLSAHDDVSDAVHARPGRRRGRQRRARPAERARQRAHADPPGRARRGARRSSTPALTVDTLDRAGIEAAGMGAFAGVARGSHEEPRLITLRYDARAIRSGRCWASSARP